MDGTASVRTGLVAAAPADGEADTLRVAGELNFAMTGEGPLSSSLANHPAGEGADRYGRRGEADGRRAGRAARAGSPGRDRLRTADLAPGAPVMGRPPEIKSTAECPHGPGPRGGPARSRTTKYPLSAHREVPCTRPTPDERRRRPPSRPPPGAG
ncbi:hypothetical protein GCM10010106_05080 [Thermopolyspora flexuosa]|nr:hypothetical protein GCM10010106_05080 [Thermopolyspora flexuosa]